MSEIETLLIKLEERLKRNHPKGYSILCPGATDELIYLLKVKVFKGKALPSELEILYRWHNGQEGYYSFSPEDNRTFLPIEEAISAWEFLCNPEEDILQPWSDTWYPIAHNGAGDYLVLETEGVREGKIIRYWHDWDDRSVESDSLLNWLLNVYIESDA